MVGGVCSFTDGEGWAGGPGVCVGWGCDACGLLGWVEVGGGLWVGGLWFVASCDLRGVRLCGLGGLRFRMWVVLGWVGVMFWFFGWLVVSFGVVEGVGRVCGVEKLCEGGLVEV